MSSIAPNGISAYVFIFDACANEQNKKCLTVIVQWTRECLAIVPAARIRSGDVIAILSQLFALYGCPAFILSHNGPEFVATSIQAWLREQDVSTSYIQLGQPWQNGATESFNAGFGADCLDVEWFRDRREERPNGSSRTGENNTLRTGPIVQSSTKDRFKDEPPGN